MSLATGQNTLIQPQGKLGNLFNQLENGCGYSAMALYDSGHFLSTIRTLYEYESESNTSTNACPFIIRTCSMYFHCCSMKTEMFDHCCTHNDTEGVPKEARLDYIKQG